MKFTEYAMWFIFLLLFLQTLAALPDQDSFYDMVDGLEEQGMETVSQRHLGRKGTDLDLVEQLNIYEVWHATTWDHKDNVANWHGIAAMAWHGCNGCNIILWGNSDYDSKFNQMHKFRWRYLMGVELLQEDDGGNISQSWREDFGVCQKELVAIFFTKSFTDFNSLDEATPETTHLSQYFRARLLLEGDLCFWLNKMDFTP